MRPPMLSCLLLSVSLVLGQTPSPSADPLAVQAGATSVAPLPPEVTKLLAGAAYPSAKIPSEATSESPQETSAEPKRRALPSPWESPPFPTSEYQGFPLIGVPVDTTRYAL